MLRLLSLWCLVLVTSSCGPSASRCSPATCASGCCSATDECVAGTELAACGFGGNTCNVCSGAQLCQAHACGLGVGGGSTGGSSGTGGGSASGGGMGAAGGTATGGGAAVTDGGVAIHATAETWTWVDFPDAVCGNGSATGLGVNLTTRSTDLFIYLEGGGACWDQTTCITFPTAANLTGYTEANFKTDSFITSGVLDRAESKNPFRDMSYVYVPYCTGDVHAGDAIQSYGTGLPLVYHRGGKNIEVYLHRLAATFTGATRVFLSGSSAGAYGAELNYSRVAAAFPNAVVHVLADCGPMIQPANALLSSWFASWKPAFPSSCASCATDFTAYPDWLITQHPASRIGLLAYEQDNVLDLFFGYTFTQMKAQTDTLISTRYDGKANARYFVLANQAHVMFGGLYSLQSADGGVRLDDWVKGWVDGSSAWVDTRP